MGGSGCTEGSKLESGAGSGLWDCRGRTATRASSDMTLPTSLTTCNHQTACGENKANWSSHSCVCRPPGKLAITIGLLSCRKFWVQESVLYKSLPNLLPHRPQRSLKQLTAAGLAKAPATCTDNMQIHMTDLADRMGCIGCWYDCWCKKNGSAACSTDNSGSFSVQMRGPINCRLQNQTIRLTARHGA